MALVDAGADAGSQTQSHCLEGNDTLGDTCEFVPVTVSGDSITLSRSHAASLSRKVANTVLSLTVAFG